MSSVKGTLHVYHTSPTLTAFEFGDKALDKVVLFIGGLTDTFLSVPYLVPYAEVLEGQGWSLVQLSFSSSVLGYGIGSLARDVSEIASCVEYFEKLGRRIVIHGHSTGTQDIMAYLDKSVEPSSRPRIYGAILQAPVSDREWIEHTTKAERLKECLEKAEAYLAQGKGDELMPRDMSDTFGSAPLTAYRCHSLVAFGGDDDFFSSDLTEERTKQIWTMAPEMPLLVLLGAADEYYPPQVDKEALRQRWHSLRSNSSFVILDGASHQVNDVQARQVMFEHVVKYLDRCEI